MAPLIDHLLFNVASAAILAPIAYASKWLRRPAITHCLWLIVLARLVMPPMITWSWGFPVSARVESEPTSEIVAEIPVLDDTVVEEVPLPILQPVESAPLEPVDVKTNWIPWILGLWATVSTFFAAALVSGAIRFRKRILNGIGPDERLHRLVMVLSRRMRVAAPRVVLLPGRISPCVWAGLIRPTLILPIGWLGSLSRLQQSAVLIHELAHLRRRDHWVRWLESIVLVLFWWHPIVWVARRELREAEELCCDGWVLSALPAARRAYADALVDTLDFLATARPALPPLASGLGQVRELQRRIHMILKANHRHRIGRSGIIAAFGLMLLLPFGIARSDEPQEPPTPPAPPTPPGRPAEPRPERRDFEEKERARVREERGVRAARERNQTDEADHLRDELKRAEEQMEQARHRIERIRRRMEEMGIKQPQPATPVPNRARMPFAGGEKSRAPDSDMEKVMLKLRLQEIELREKLGEDHPEVAKIRRQMDEVKQAIGGRGEGRQPLLRSTAGPLPPASGERPMRSPDGRDGADQRIDELTKAVAELRRAVEEMRRDRERDRRPPAGPNP